ncbi:MAG: cupin domain-containing protein [Myxococcales bacterium]|nr:cupin domain-containing protein [Myxococcales bacterium]
MSVVENSITGERIVFLGNVSEDGREHLAMDFFVRPAGGVPMEHYHAEQTEVFRMIRGRLSITVEGERRELHPGEVLEIPPGTRHSIVNPSAEEAYCRVEYHPPGMSQWFLERVHGFTEHAGREPSLLELSPLLARGVEVWPAKVPARLGRALMPILAALSRLLGRAHVVEEGAARYFATRNDSGARGA